MSDQDREKDTVAERIRKSFANVALDGGTTIHEADVIDDYGTDVQRVAARKLDPKEHWWEVSAEKVEKFYAALFFLDQGIPVLYSRLYDLDARELSRLQFRICELNY